MSTDKPSTDDSRYVTYVFRGLVERGTGRRRAYVWKNGYSETSPSGGVSFPWMTRRECQLDARSRDLVARFQEAA